MDYHLASTFATLTQNWLFLSCVTFEEKVRYNTYCMTAIVNYLGIDIVEICLILVLVIYFLNLIKLHLHLQGGLFTANIPC